jgi:hypothetical protein
VGHDGVVVAKAVVTAHERHVAVWECPVKEGTFHRSRRGRHEIRSPMDPDGKPLPYGVVSRSLEGSDPTESRSAPPKA